MEKELDLLWANIKALILNHIKEVKKFEKEHHGKPDSYKAYCPLEKRILVGTGIYPYIKEIYLYEDAKYRKGLQTILHVNLEEPNIHTFNANLYFRDGLPLFADGDIFKEQKYVEYLKIILSELNASTETMEIFQHFLNIIQKQSGDGLQMNKSK